MIGRSLETLACAWSAPTATREVVADFLRDHPKVAKVHYLTFLPADCAERRVYEAQCDAAGLDLLLRRRGGETEAFRVPQRAEDLQARGEPRRH